MTREDFVTRLIGSASIADLIHNLRQGLDEMDLKDRAGTSLTPDFELAQFLIESKTGEFPTLRVCITLEEMTIKCKGMTFAFPTERACRILNEFDRIHVAFHDAIISVISEAFHDLSTEQERVLGELLHRNPLHLN